MPALFLLALIVAAPSAQALAQSGKGEDFASFFQKVCVDSAYAGQTPADVINTVTGWQPIEFPTDYRFDKADQNQAWSGTIGGRQFQLLFSRRSKKQSGGTICKVRSPVQEQASEFFPSFLALMKSRGFKISKSVSPYVYRASGKGPSGKHAELGLASALLVRWTDGTRPKVFYLDFEFFY